MYESQLKLKRERKAEEKYQPYKGVRKSEDKMRQERSRLDMAKIEISGDSAERGKKKRVETIKKHNNFYAKGCEIKNVCFPDMPIILIMYKKTYFNTNDLDHYIPSVYVFLLQDFKIFRDEIPNGLLLIRGIEHQIDLVSKAYIPNRPTYKSNPD
jgi:hypothetical protein